MAFYVVTESVRLVSGDKTLKKDKVFTETEVSPENLERWLRKGYVRMLDDKTEGEAQKDTGELPYYLTVDYYLTPDEVNKLKQKELIEYGNHIGVPDIKPNTTVPNLKKQINEFILSVDDADDKDGGDNVD